MTELDLVELLADEKVADVLTNGSHLDLAVLVGVMYCGFTEADVEYIRIFWDVAFNKSWIYLSDEMIIERMGYKKSEHTITNFVKGMKKKYKDQVDYKEISKTNSLVVEYYKSCKLINTCKHNKDYYAITGETFKKMLLRAGTKQGDITCDYFIKVESMSNLITKLVFKYAEKTLLMEKEAEIKQKEEQMKIELKEKDAALNRLNILNLENLSFKKKMSRDETIYIVSTKTYADQGIFKIGRTKNMKHRSSTYNTGRPAGDKIKVLATYAVNDATLIERNIHSKLSGLALKDETEIFMCPFDLLQSLVDLAIHCDEQLNDMVNKIVDTVYKLRSQAFDQTAWTSGLDMDVFKDEIALTINGEVAIKIKVVDLSDEQKQELVDKFIQSFREQNEEPDKKITVLWRSIQTQFITELGIPKSHFKPSIWRKHFEANKEVDIQYRARICN